MKQVTILKGSTIRAAKPSRPFGYFPDVIQATVEHFGFAEYPIDLSKLIPHGNVDAESPAMFRHGKIEIDGQSLLIDELQVFSNGTIVSTPNSTIESDRITEYVFQWAGDKFQLQFQPIRPLSHFSQLEVRFERPLPDLFAPLKEIGETINKSLDAFWESSMPPYQLTNIHFGIDPTKAPVVNTGVFKIEARAQMPFEMGLYFCEAAMTTDNHLAILNRFERICLERFAERGG